MPPGDPRQARSQRPSQAPQQPLGHREHHERQGHRAEHEGHPQRRQAVRGNAAHGVDPQVVQQADHHERRRGGGDRSLATIPRPREPPTDRNEHVTVAPAPHPGVPPPPEVLRAGREERVAIALGHTNSEAAHVADLEAREARVRAVQRNRQQRLAAQELHVAGPGMPWLAGCLPRGELDQQEDHRVVPQHHEHSEADPAEAPRIEHRGAHPRAAVAKHDGRIDEQEHQILAAASQPRRSRRVDVIAVRRQHRVPADGDAGEREPVTAEPRRGHHEDQRRDRDERAEPNRARRDPAGQPEHQHGREEEVGERGRQARQEPRRARIGSNGQAGRAAQRQAEGELAPPSQVARRQQVRHKRHGTKQREDHDAQRRPFETCREVPHVTHVPMSEEQRGALAEVAHAEAAARSGRPVGREPAR